MRVLFDTNVLLDALLERDPFAENAVFLLNAVKARKIDGFISATTVTDIYYLVRKRTKSSDKAFAAVINLLRLMSICPVDRLIIEAAASLTGTDFEDNIQLACAASLELDAIVTRDKAGFEASSILIMSSADLETLVQGQSDGNPAITL